MTPRRTNVENVTVVLVQHFSTVVAVAERQKNSSQAATEIKQIKQAKSYDH